MSKIALITGATSGIGEATARRLADEGYRLIICGRRQDRLEKLSEELDTAVLTRSFDVRDREAVLNVLGNLPDQWSDIDVLVNNAGNAHGMAPFNKANLDDFDAMIDINVKGLLYVSHAVIPGMIQRNRGHIVNIGSVAGKEVYPNGNVYCASKFAVDAINQAMRIDLNAYDIKVTAVNPGLVETEFSKVRFKGDEGKADQTYRGMKPLNGDDIADIIAFVISRQPHVMIADLLVFPVDQASATLVNRKKQD